jgi:hypothetical protein
METACRLDTPICSAISSWMEVATLSHAVLMEVPRKKAA